MNSEKKEEEFSFEKGYSRLEKILDELNSGETELERSLKLYEEADSLILYCNQKLTSAEKKIQTLIKKRGELLLDDKNQPVLESFPSFQEEATSKIPYDS